MNKRESYVVIKKEKLLQIWSRVAIKVNWEWEWDSKECKWVKVKNGECRTSCWFENLFTACAERKNKFITWISKIMLIYDFMF